MFDHLPFSPATGTNPYFSTVLLEKGGNLDGSHILTYRRGRALCSTSRVRAIVYPGIHTSRVQVSLKGGCQILSVVLNLVRQLLYSITRIVLVRTLKFCASGYFASIGLDM